MGHELGEHGGGISGHASSFLGVQIAVIAEMLSGMDRTITGSFVLVRARASASAA